MSAAVTRAVVTRTVTSLALLSAGVALAGPALARGPQVIIFGGGSDPASTPLSVEAHVLALAQALAPSEPRVLFGSGRPEQRTVQILDTVPDRAGDWLARVLGPDGPVGVAYRSARTQGAGTTRAEVLAALTAAAADKRGAIVLGAGHGLPAHDDQPAALALWGADQLTPAQLAAALDGPRTKGPLAFVLGQCHSGAFTAAVHTGAELAAPLAQPTRCVLAAAPADRTASGCTPDASDPGARAYLALVAEALAARGPRPADFGGDGKVSLAEAHAWAVLNDDTIDLPVKSSEAWVRDILGEEAEKLHALPAPRVQQLARPEVRAVLRGLRGPDADAAGVRLELDALDDQLDALDDQISPLAEQRDQALDALRLMLLTRWPELSSPYHRVARSLLSARADQLADAVEAAPEAAQVRALDARIGALQSQYEALERGAVRLERWLRTFDTVALEAALRKRGTPEQIAGLDALIACEAMTP